jgi:NADH-quinone oxidoreductase subunit J
MIEVDQVAFAVISALTIGAAIFSLEARNVVYGAVALAFTFLGLAGLFIILDATFIAMFQIIVNVGAVAVLILFTVMLVGEGTFFKEVRNPVARSTGIVAAAVLAITLGISFVSSNFPKPGPEPNFANIGTYITSQYAFSIEILALVFGTALIGALTLAKLDKPEQQKVP